MPDIEDAANRLAAFLPSPICDPAHNIWEVALLRYLLKVEPSLGVLKLSGSDSMAPETIRKRTKIRSVAELKTLVVPALKPKTCNTVYGIS